MYAASDRPRVLCSVRDWCFVGDDGLGRHGHQRSYVYLSDPTTQHVSNVGSLPSYVLNHAASASESQRLAASRGRPWARASPFRVARRRGLLNTVQDTSLP